MKRLLLLRHAKSSWDDTSRDDHDRPLNKRGRRAARAMGRLLAATATEPDLVLCSSSRRTRETLAGLEASGFGPVETRVDERLYLASAADLLALLNALDGDVDRALVIAHNPGIGELAAELAASGDPETLAQLRRKYPTGALAELDLATGDWRQLAAGGARLVRFVRPRDLDS